VAPHRARDLVAPDNFKEIDMATFTVAAGTDWIQTFRFGSSVDRWRLDDYHIWLHVKKSGVSTVLLDLNTQVSGLTITDPVSRVLEANAGWDQIEEIEPGPFEFDILFENKTTGIRSRSGPHTLTITRGITFPET
jgi:hypothetical protein